MGMEDHDDGEHTRGRWWIDAVRYVVFALVTALTVATIAKAVSMTLRSEKLYLKVVNGSVSVVRFSPGAVKLSLILQAYNPSGRAFIRYNDVNVTLLYNNGLEITWILLSDGAIAVEPEILRETRAVVKLDVPSELPYEFVRMILKEGEVRDATVQLNGTVQTVITGRRYTRGHNTQFRCPHVNIVNVSLHQHALEDVSCDEVS